MSIITNSFSFQNQIRVVSGLLNMSNGKAGLTEGTDAATLKTATAVDFCIDGVPGVQKAATDNIAMTACATQVKSSYCKYLVTIAIGGAITVTKGNDAATAALALMPARPVGGAPIGFFQILTDAATTFTSGTTDLGAAGITETYGDMNSVVTMN